MITRPGGSRRGRRMAIAIDRQGRSTIADRSIMIPMQRKAPGQAWPGCASTGTKASACCSKSARWVADHIDALRQADPEMPALNDRQAGLIGAHCSLSPMPRAVKWPGKARAAAQALCEIDEDAETIGVQLLA